MTDWPPSIVLGRYHRWAAVTGAVLIGLGIVAAGSTALGEAIALTLAVLLMASGLVQLGLALFSANWRPAILHLVAATADVLIGFLLLANPGDAAFTINAFLIVYLFIGGLHRVVHSIWLRPPGWTWLLVTGILALILACFLRFGVPGFSHAKLWLIGGCIALDFVMHGAGWIMVSRAASPANSPPPANVEIPNVAERPIRPIEPREYETPFEHGQRAIDAEFERLQESEQGEQAKLEKLKQDIQRAKRVNKDVLPDE